MSILTDWQINFKDKANYFSNASILSVLNWSSKLKQISDIFKHWIHWSWLFQSHWAAIGFMAILDLSSLYLSSFIFKKIQYGVFLKPCGKFIVCCGHKQKDLENTNGCFCVSRRRHLILCNVWWKQNGLKCLKIACFLAPFCYHSAITDVIRCGHGCEDNLTVLDASMHSLLLRPSEKSLH